MEATNLRRYGTREEVANDQALMTKGRLTKDMLVLDEKTGRYKSVNMIENGKRLAAQRKTKAAETPVVSDERLSVQGDPLQGDFRDTLRLSMSDWFCWSINNKLWFAMGNHNRLNKHILLNSLNMLSNTWAFI